MAGPKAAPKRVDPDDEEVETEAEADTFNQKEAPSGRPTLDDVDEFLRVIWYGDGGKGKTTHMATLANRGRIVFISADPGLKAKALKRQGVNIANIELMRAEEISYKALDDLFWELKERLEDDPQSVLGVMWDSLTEVVAMLVRQETAKGVVKAQNAGRQRQQFDVYVEDYGVMTEQMRDLIRKFRDLPCHVGYSALSRRDRDEDDKVRVGPAVTPKLQEDLIGYADIIINVRVETFGDEVEYSGLCLPEGRFEAKDRFGILPRRMVNPTFERVIDYIDEVIDASDDPLQIEARQRRARVDADAKK